MPPACLGLPGFAASPLQVGADEPISSDSCAAIQIHSAENPLCSRPLRLRPLRLGSVWIVSAPAPDWVSQCPPTSSPGRGWSPARHQPAGRPTSDNSAITPISFCTCTLGRRRLAVAKAALQVNGPLLHATTATTAKPCRSPPHSPLSDSATGGQAPRGRPWYAASRIVSASAQAWDSVLRTYRAPSCTPRPPTSHLPPSRASPPRRTIVE